MRNILTVSGAAGSYDLTTLDRVKDELDITNNASDSKLQTKITEASADIVAHLGFDQIVQETVVERFWAFNALPEYLMLRRRPATSITSVVVDDVTLASTRYRLDEKAGALYALDAGGKQSVFDVTDEVLVTYVGGYVTPGNAGRTLPYPLESAAVDLVQSYWFARGRDPQVREEDIPGIARVVYWVGAVGREGDLPPSVESKIAPFRKVSI